MLVTLHLVGEAQQPVAQFFASRPTMTLHRADSSKMRLPKKPLAIAEVEDEHRATTLEDSLLARVAGFPSGRRVRHLR
jgi:hypothetical protein